MFRFFRAAHKVAGLVGSLFLILIGITGFVLALKSVVPSIRIPTQKGTEIASPAELIHPSLAFEAAFSQGIPELKSVDDVDRFELHAGKNVYKIHSKEGYHEVQVDAGTAKVLSVGKRNDQFMEDVHDLSFFHPTLRETLLPVVAVCLTLLGFSGLVIYFIPVIRRAKHKKKAA